MTTLKKIILWIIIILIIWFLIQNIIGIIGLALPLLLVIAAIAVIDALIPNLNILGTIGNLLSKFINWIQGLFKR